MFNFIVCILAFIICVYNLANAIMELNDIKSAFICKKCGFLNEKIHKHKICEKCKEPIEEVNKRWMAYFGLIPITIDTKTDSKQYIYKDIAKNIKINIIFWLVLIMIFIACTLIQIFI